MAINCFIRIAKWKAAKALFTFEDEDINVDLVDEQIKRSIYFSLLKKICMFLSKLLNRLQKNCTSARLDSKKTPFVHLTLDSPRFLTRLFAGLQIPRRVFANEIET